MRESNSNYFFLSFLLLTLPLIVSPQSLKNYGDPCDNDCDERLGLLCSPETSTCTCMLPNSTIYSSSRGYCVIKAGHPCRRIITGNDQLCVPNAACKASSNCECMPNFFQTRNGTCLPVAKHGEPCGKTKPCDKAGGMECVGSKGKQQFLCQCKYPRDQYYDSEEKKCISYAGGNCSFDLPCVRNANCSLDIFELRRRETPQGKGFFMYNATVGRKCGCLPGHRMTSSRLCLPSYEAPCSEPNNDNDSGNHCNPEENLECFDKRICLCQSPLHQVYFEGSEGKGKCLNLLGSKRSTRSGGTTTEECVPGAEFNEGVCVCKEGFTPTSGRTCLKGFGQPCVRQGECNLFRGLSCKDGKCACFDPALHYGEEEKSCLAGERSPCGDVQVVIRESRKDEEKGGKVRFVFELEEKGKGCLGEDMSQKIEIGCQAGLQCVRREGYFQCAR